MVKPVSPKRIPARRGTPLSPEDAHALRLQIRDRGAHAIAADTGLAPSTVASLASGAGANESSKLLIRIWLAERNAAP
jgi:hypothetical protein